VYCVGLQAIGGTGGLGSKIIQHLKNYEVISVGSSNVDLSNSEQIKNFVEQNDFDILVIFSNYNYNSFLHKYSDSISELTKQIDINIKGNTQLISESLKKMRNKNWGRIIIASSVTVDKPIMGTGVYASCKAFFENLVKTIAIENASKNITANCIQLGYMDGGLLYTLPEDFLEKIKLEIPSKRIGSIEEIYKTLDFIINNEYINGKTIKLTGGL
jgi:NAD(P)-dependent dehydrogenase (short-subunit alcohol dehydrogenase family)